MSVTEPPQFTVRVSGLTLPPVPALAFSVHWLSANVTLTVLLGSLAATVREQVEVVIPAPVAGELVQPVQPET